MSDCIDLFERLVTVADEAFGLGPVESIDDTITRIEREIFALRGEVTLAESRSIQGSHVAAMRISELEAEVQRLLCWTIGDFVDGEMDPERETAFRLHLEKCTACQAEVVSLMAMAERLKERLKERSDGR